MSDLDRLIQPDGTVIVPDTVAAEVLRRLVRDMVAEARTTGGQPFPAAHRRAGTRCRDRSGDGQGAEDEEVAGHVRLGQVHAVLGAEEEVL